MSLFPAPVPLSRLAESFRCEAEVARRYSPRAARVWEYAAAEVERALEAHLDEVLPIAVAAAEWGWSYEAIRRKVVSMPDLNAGVEHAPAIRRRELPNLGAPRVRVDKEDAPEQESAPGKARQTSPSGAGAAVPSEEVESPFERIKRHALRDGKRPVA